MNILQLSSKVNSILGQTEYYDLEKKKSIFNIFNVIQNLRNNDPEVRNLNLIEKLWSTWYIFINNDVLATGLLFFLVHEIVYFGRCLPWYVIEKIHYFDKWKIQKKEKVSDKEQLRCFLAVFKLHLMIEILPIFLFYPVCSKLNISIDIPFPNWKTLFFQICLFFFCEDFWHYWAHRLFHYGWFYKNVHKQHHFYKSPFGLTAEYAHPIEVVSLGFGTVGFPIIYAFISKTKQNWNLPVLHLITITSWISLRLLQAVDSHSGYDFPWSLHVFFPLWAGAHHHDLHHEHFKSNFSSSFTWLDYLFGTDYKKKKITDKKN